MARLDVRLAQEGGKNAPAHTYQVVAAGTDILVGEPVMQTTAGDRYVVPVADGGPVVGTNVFVGVSDSNSDQTASADGEVVVGIPQEGQTYYCKAKTYSNVDTAAKIKALQNKRVPFDLTAGVYTVDTAAADSANNIIQIVDGDPATGVLLIQFRQSGTLNN